MDLSMSIVAKSSNCFNGRSVSPIVSLKRRFDLDDDYLEDLKIDLI